MAHANRKTPTGPALTFGAILLVASLGCGSAAQQGDEVTSLLPPGGATDAGSQPGTDTQPSTPTDPGSPAEPVQPVVPALKVAFAAELPQGDFAALERTSISSIAVYVVADWTGVGADETERLKLVAPSGAVYSTTNLSLADGSTSLVDSWVLPDGTRRVAYKVLIRGTTIEQYNQVGAWTASVKLVGGDLVGTATLTLE